MTQSPHNQFATDYLNQVLSPIGLVKTRYEIPEPVQEIDIYFTPNTTANDDLLSLGLLGRFAQTPALFEPFGDAVTPDQIRDCLSKLFHLHVKLDQRAKQENRSLNEEELPRLWILIPTASASLLEGFAALPDEQNWLSGIYFMPEFYYTAIVVIDQLPPTPETRWLRLLGTGQVKQQAIDELSALPNDRPKTIQRGMRQGIQAGQRLIINNVLRTRLGDLTPTLAALVTPLSALPPQELTPFVLKFSQLENNAAGSQQAQHFIVENLLKIRFGELDAQLLVRVTPILKLSPQELSQYLSQLSQISRDQLLERFPEASPSTSP